MTDHAPTVFTVPLGRPFLAALAEAILAGDLPRQGGTPPTAISLSQMTLLLPTRRAARALGEAFLQASGGRALLLPRIRPISEGQEDLALLAPSPGGEAGFELDIPPAVSEIERRLVLTQLVLQWSRLLRAGSDGVAAGASTPAQAANLAAELAQLMDMVETEGASLEGLEKLVPEDYSAHWAQTIDFLRIVVQMWPAYLAEKGRLGPAARRNAVIKAEAQRITAGTPTGPVIVAGVTGSIPATVQLMQAVGARDNGAIVLPAFDQGLDAEACALIAKGHPEHPQFGLAKLLGHLGVAPEQVQRMPGRALAPHLLRRQTLVSEAMRPAPTLEQWQRTVAETSAADVAASIKGISLIETPTADDEAEVVALILRHAVEQPGATAALVSPDRLLARRVVNRLETMGIAVDDSAGRPLAKTPPGAFLVLIADAFATEFAPVALVALLKHPLARLGRGVPEIRRAARAIELIAFRMPYLGRGLDGVGNALDLAEADLVAGKRRQRAVRRLRDEDRASARALIADLQKTFEPLMVHARTGEPASLKFWAEAHAATAEALAAVPGETTADVTTTAPKAPEPTTELAPAPAPEPVASPLRAGEAGEAAHAFFSEVLDEQLAAPELSAADYPDFYRGLTASINVRPRLPAHPRISIWGPFEARLQQPDVIVLGALNDGTWPASADPGAWLSRPMRAELGLPSPEEKIGYAAHDFTSFMGAERVYLTRSSKMDGVPTVPSRWLMRLLALLDGCGIGEGRTARQMLVPDQPWQAWARARDTVTKAPALQPPAPRPVVSWRPRKLPVTAIERWIANPYGIYAQHILKLEKLDAIGGVPGAALKGQIIHDALHRFATRYPRALPNDVAAALLDEAREAMAAYAAHPRVAAFWLPRFERFAHWFAETEPARRVGLEQVVAEVEGQAVLQGPAGAFTLTARADRMDLASASLAITDYKTGRAPTDNRVLSGRSPQLPLEAAIALDGGFVGVSRPGIGRLAYIRVSGGEPAGEFRAIKTNDAAGLAQTTRAGLERLIADFDKQATPYRAVRRHAFADSYAFDDFAHLARVAEWSASEDGGEEG